MTWFISVRGTATGGLESSEASLLIDGEQLTRSDAVAQFTEAIRGQDLILATHGFNVDQARGVASLGGWSQALGLPANALFVGLLWPGDSALFPVLDYPVEGESAMRSAQVLARFLDATLTAANSVALVSHSLGARFVLETVHRLEKARVGKLVLMAGAIEDDCLTNEYVQTAGQVDEIHVLASRGDWVLEFAFPIGNPVGEIVMHGHPYFRTALGRAGPADGYPRGTRGRSCQIPDGWNYGHSSYLPGGPIPPLAAPAPDCPQADAPAPDGEQDWQPRWSASVVARDVFG